MRSVGLTGGIGSGKSEVTRRLARHGAVVIDSDVLAREVVEPGTPGLAAVAAEFGAGVLAADGSLDGPSWPRSCRRPAPAGRAERDRPPLVRARSASLTDRLPPGRSPRSWCIRRCSGGRLAALRPGRGRGRAGVEQLDRLVRSRDGRGGCEGWIAAQASRERRLAVADYVLDNSGDLDALDAAVDRLWKWLKDRLAAAR
jgi:dephospho-CoA kinase